MHKQSFPPTSKAYSRPSSPGGGSWISASVGQGGVNRMVDVELVQQCLSRHARWLETPAPAVTGIADAPTVAAIKSFQKNAAVLLMPDGVVSPRGFTIKQLLRASIPYPKHRVFQQACFSHSTTPLSEADFADAASTIGCESATVQAVAIVEGTDWDALGGPGILFERHKFSYHTRDIYDHTHPDISNRHAGNYGLLRNQYPKLRRAGILDEDAALKSASWGKFQILGENFASCGFGSVASFVDAMMKSEQEHLKAFAKFTQNNGVLKKAMIDHAWTTIAVRYNGAAQRGYDTKLKDAYDKIKASEKNMRG